MGVGNRYQRFNFTNNFFLFHIDILYIERSLKFIGFPSEIEFSDHP